MLVIKTEIWPRGDINSRFEIARIGIINQGDSLTSGIADYNVISILDRDQEERTAEGVLVAHFRQNGWRPLAARALAVDTQSLFHPDYTRTIVDVLKRG